MLTDCNSLVTVCASKTGPKPSPLDPMQPVMERSHPTSGRSTTPADINRNGRPTSIGTSGRHQSECPADIIGMRILDRYIDLATPMGRGFMAMMSAMAEDERLRIIKRTHEGRQIARAKGVRMGRKPKLTAHQMKEARQRLAQGEPTRSLAKSYGVSISTISRLAA